MTLRNRLLIGAAAAGLALLAACQPADPPAPPARASSPKENVVPIIRPFPLAAMSEPQVVEFELAPPGPNASSSLSIGVRVRAADDVQVAGIAERVVREGGPAEISLERIESSGSQPVPLTRREFKGFEPSEMVAVDAEGRVPGAVPDSADETSLVDAGLAEKDGHYRTLTFAWAEQITPGRYRLRIRLLAPGSGLQPLPAELQLAYTHRAK